MQSPLFSFFEPETSKTGHLTSTLLHYQLPHSVPQVVRLQRPPHSATAADPRSGKALGLPPMMTQTASHKPTLRGGAVVPLPT